jgi:hypothetical protein
MSSLVIPPGSRAPSTRLAENFRQDIASAFGQVVAQEISLDSIQVLMDVEEGHAALRFLKAEAVKAVPRYTGHPMWPFSLRIHQPSAGIITALDGNLSRHLVNRFDLAIDYLFPEGDQVGPGSLQEFVASRVTQRWHGKRKAMLVEDETMYLAGAWRGRGGAVYSTRPSKANGMPCTHVELRFYSARSSGAGVLIACQGCFKLIQRPFCWPSVG